MQRILGPSIAIVAGVAGGTLPNFSLCLLLPMKIADFRQGYYVWEPMLREQKEFKEINEKYGKSSNRRFYYF